MGWLGERGGRKKEDERIKALERAVESLESKNRMLKVEWESVLDKVNSVMGRLNARIRKHEALSPPENNTDVSPQPPPLPSPAGNHATMSAMRGRHRGVLPG